jgi:hypothetical protein
VNQRQTLLEHTITNIRQRDTVSFNLSSLLPSHKSVLAFGIGCSSKNAATVPSTYYCVHGGAVTSSEKRTPLAFLILWALRPRQFIRILQFE